MTNAPQEPPSTSQNATDLHAWQGPGNFWLAYPAGFGVIGILFGVIAGVALGNPGVALVGAGFAGAALALYGLIACALLLLTRSLTFEGIGKLVGLASALLFGGALWLVLTIFPTEVDPIIGLAAGIIGGALATAIGQFLARSLLFRRALLCYIVVGLVFVGLGVAIVVQLTATS